MMSRNLTQPVPLKDFQSLTAVENSSSRGFRVLLMQRKGQVEYGLMFGVFLFFMLLVAGAVVAAVFIFLGDEYSFKEIEAELLHRNIRACVFQQPDVLALPQDEFFAACGMNTSVMLQGKMIVKICRNTDCIRDEKPLFVVGSNFDACRFEGTNNNFLRCEERSMSIDGTQIQIVTGSNHQIQRRRA